jgi:hypothetical protein
MTTISTASIDATKPEAGSATTASVRANFAEIITQLTNAGTDIDGIISGGTALTNVDINSGNIDGTIIGAASSAAGTFTVFTSNGIDDNATATQLTITDTAVGIGTASPQRNVTIHKAAADSSILQLTNTTTGTATGNDGLRLGVDASGIGYLFQGEAQPLILGTNDLSRLHLDASGNLGLGVTPEAWNTSYSALQIGNGLGLWASKTGLDGYIYSNAYNDGTNKYQQTGAASRLVFGSDGSAAISVAPSGTADTTITWHTALTIDTSGAHTIAAPSSAAIALTVNGFANQRTQRITGDSTTGQSYGLQVLAGTNTSDEALHVANQTGTSVNLLVDGAGNVVVSNAALATTATDGFLYIPTCAGAPTGTPTAKTGRVPIVFDSTNNQIYIYDGSWLSTAALT